MSRLASILALSLVVAPLARAQEAKPAEAAPAAAAPAAAPADAAKPAADAAKPAEETKPAEAAPAAAAPANGALSVSSTPPGKLFLDGKDTGLVTPVVDLPVAPGAHTIKVVEEATGRETSTEFTMEAGGSLSLNLNLPEAAPVATPTTTPDAAQPVATPEPAAAEAPAPWTWMTVAGWAGLGLGTIGLLSGAVVLTTPTDPDQGPLGFGLFGAGVGLLIGGGVLLYLDTELQDDDKPAEEPKPADAPAAAPAASN